METPVTEIMSSLLAMMEDGGTIHYTPKSRYIERSVIQTGATQ
jgi:hypothetical protein